MVCSSKLVLFICCMASPIVPSPLDMNYVYHFLWLPGYRVGISKHALIWKVKAKFRVFKFG